MSGVNLTAATRQNLLSLQDTASLTATTQNRLSTGLKVSSALDNPINFFTSQSLNQRSGDLSSLLDGISNGVQAIQAANQGITSIQKLVDSAKSVANQALSTQITTTGTAKTAPAYATAGTVSMFVNGVSQQRRRSLLMTRSILRSRPLTQLSAQAVFPRAPTVRIL